MSKPFNRWNYDDAASAVQAKYVLLYMCPDFTSVNFGNNGLVNSMLSSESGLCSVPASSEFLLYLAHLLVGKLGDAVVFTTGRKTDLKSVFGITGKGDVLQVTDSIISLYAVDMIDIVTFWFWPNKRSYNQALYRVSSLLSVEAESGVPVTVRPHAEFQYSTHLSTSSRYVSSGSSEVRNRVDSGVPANNRTPFFFFEFFSAKFVGRHGMNLLHRFVSSLGWSGVQSSFQSV